MLYVVNVFTLLALGPPSCNDPRRISNAYDHDLDDCRTSFVHAGVRRRPMSKASSEPSPWAAGAVVLALAVGGVSALFSGCGSGDIGAAPDVRGLTLPTAKAQLKKANYSSDVKSDGLGVFIEENWTVCKQKKPKGRLVPIEVSKDC